MPGLPLAAVQQCGLPNLQSLPQSDVPEERRDMQCRFARATSQEATDVEGGGGDIQVRTLLAAESLKTRGRGLLEEAGAVLSKDPRWQ